MPPVDVTPPVEPPSVEPTAEPTESADQEPTPAVSSTDEADDVESSAPGWLVPGLTGAGAVLAALVLLAVRAHRNTQLRYRRPGQTIAPPPEELRAVEKTAFVVRGPADQGHRGSRPGADAPGRRVLGRRTGAARSSPPHSPKAP